MRILVTGAAGFIGSHLAEALLAGDHEVVGFDNFDPFYSREIKERNLAAALAEPRFQLIEGDLRDRDAVRGLFSGGGYDVVVHLAAKAGVRPSLADPESYVTTNVVGTSHLLDAMKASGVRRLVFASSSSVYGNNEKVPFHEDDRVDRPISVYAMTKKAGEELCHVHAAVHGVRTMCLRFFTVYGPRQRPEMAIHDFTRRLFEGEEIPLFGDGSMERDFTFVDDVVRGVVVAIERVDDVEYEIVNLGNSSPVSLTGLLEALARATGRSPRVVHRPVPPGDVRRTFASVERAAELLGFAPDTPLDRGLERFVEWYAAERPGARAPLERGPRAAGTG
ncbi:MAG TPA: NAD-dependent epimerase/dehydratase family protein [Gemmatimonadota bacterium]|nr:NAD-dependent epimerase/dehydratase family protein [Gemmatimonadota bacterium]